MNYDEMPAGPEMDRAVAEKVCGWPEVEGYPGMYRSPNYLWYVGDDWCPSTDLNAAVEACGDRWIVRLFGGFGQDGFPDRGWTAYLDPSAALNWESIRAWAPTPALALCRALLKAVEK